MEIPPALGAILAGREDRREELVHLLSRWTTVVTILVNVPGSDKNPPWSGLVLERGFRRYRSAIENEFGVTAIGSITRRTRASGREVLLGIDVDPTRLKERAIAIEDGEPIGRLFDIDIHTRGVVDVGTHDDTNSTDSVSVSRADLGLPERRCLVCDAPACECARSRRHSLEELEKKITELLEFADS